MHNPEEYTARVNGETLGVLLGPEIGSGMSRRVYEMKHNKDLVVKIEDKSQCFQNIREWELWKEYSGVPEIAQHLAPCVEMSSCGIVLIMKRTRMASKAQYPNRLPKFLMDHKFANFGMLGRRFVCHDYGNIPFGINFSAKSTRLIHWWGDEPPT